LLLAVLVGIANAQDVQTVDCYQCDDRHKIPECYNHAKTCGVGEVCKVTYGSSQHQPSFHCQKKDECDALVSNHLRQCIGGGVEVHLHAGHHGDEFVCAKCCNSTSCVGDIANLIELNMQTDPDLQCPGNCKVDSLTDCLTNAHTCQNGQFCKVTLEHEGKEVRGHCMDDHEHNHCLDEMQRHACTIGGNNGHVGPHCTVDCCTHESCVDQVFGVTHAPSSVAPTNASSSTLWQRLHGDCRDELPQGECAKLITSQDVCHSRLALDICADTCGLCAQLNNTVCEDTVNAGGCADLAANNDVCSDPLSVFICPKTCNKCDELINSIAISLVDGSSNVTNIPATMLPPSANPSDYPTFDCNDLTGQNCAVVGSLCSSGFIQVVCPDDCARCAAPINTGSSTSAPMPSTAMPSSMMPMTSAAASMAPASSAMPATDAPTMGPASSRAMPMTNAPSAPMISTTMMAPVTTAAAAQSQGDDNSTSASTCVDRLDGMSCTDLVDVCASVLALSVCPKYCNLC